MDHTQVTHRRFTRDRQQYSEKDSRSKMGLAQEMLEDLQRYKERQEKSPNNIHNKLNSIMPRNETPQRTAGKRPIKALTPQQKLEAIKRVHEGESKASVARDIGVPESTLRGWCKAEHKILNQVNTMKTSENFDKLSSPTESDRSTPTRSSSHSPLSVNISGPSTSGVKEPSEEVEPLAKRIKVDNDAPSASTTSLPSSGYYEVSQNLITSYLYNLMTPALRRAFLEQQALLNNNALLTSMSNASLLNGYSSGYSGTSLNNVSIMGNISNTLSTQKDHTKRTRIRANVSKSLGNSFARSSCTKNTDSSAHNSLSTPSTSSGNHVPTMSKPLQDGKHIDDIAQNLLLQQQLKQQQTANLNSEFISAWIRLQSSPTTRNIPDERVVPGNSQSEPKKLPVNHNNNIIPKNNQLETTPKPSLTSLPPGIQEAIENGTKFTSWMRQNGTIFPLNQVKPVELMVQTLNEWVIRAKEPKLNDKSNSTS